jgi:hypothetical protein
MSEWGRYGSEWGDKEMSENDVNRSRDEEANLAAGPRDWGIRTSRVIAEWGSRVEIELKADGSANIGGLLTSLDNTLHNLVDPSLGFRRLFYLHPLGQQSNQQRVSFLVSWLTERGSEEFLRSSAYNGVLSYLNPIASFISPIRTFRLVRVLVYNQNENDEDGAENARQVEVPRQLQLAGRIDDWYLKSGSEKYSFAERFERNRYKWLNRLNRNNPENQDYRFFGGIVAYSLDATAHYQVITGFRAEGDINELTSEHGLIALDDEATHWANGPSSSTWTIDVRESLPPPTPYSAGTGRPARQ